jgi:hypothetical protein
MKKVEYCCGCERICFVVQRLCDGHETSFRVLRSSKQLVISVGALREHEHKQVYHIPCIYPNDSVRKPSASPRRHTRLSRVTLESAQRQLPQLLQERCGQIIDGMHERESDTSGKMKARRQQYNIRSIVPSVAYDASNDDTEYQAFTGGAVHVTY